MFVEKSCNNCGLDDAQTLIETKVRQNCHLRGASLRTVVCTNCGLAYLNPAPSADSIARLYQDDLYQIPKAETYTHANSAAGIRTKLFAALTDRYPGALQNLSVLDIGCDRGSWLMKFDTSNRRHGIELSPMARQPLHPSLLIHEGDFIQFASVEQYDLVTAIALIEHLEDPLQGLVKMNELCKDGGYVFVYTPDLHTLRLERGVGSYFKVVHPYYFSPATLSSLYAKAGLEVVAVVQYPRVPAPSLFRPKEGASGSFALLGRKTRAVDLSQARRQPPRTDSSEYLAAVAAVRAAVSRDRSAALVSRLIGSRFGRPLMRVVGRPG